MQLIHWTLVLSIAPTAFEAATQERLETKFVLNAAAEAGLALMVRSQAVVELDRSE